MSERRTLDPLFEDRRTRLLAGRPELRGALAKTPKHDATLKAGMRGVVESFDAEPNRQRTKAVKPSRESAKP